MRVQEKRKSGRCKTLSKADEQKALSFKGKTTVCIVLYIRCCIAAFKIIMNSSDLNHINL